MHAEFEKLSQYSHRNFLIIHGIKTENGLSKNEVCKNFFQTNLGIKVEDYKISCRCHRLGKTTVNASNDEDTSTRKIMPQPIIVKFCRHDTKTHFYFAKKRLAKTSFLITECLARERQRCISQLIQMRKNNLIHSFWTLGGTIYFNKEKEGQKLSVFNIIQASQSGINL